MRVVCDNCGAVFKISESKLVKDVNRATCKRCGHKILIAKPGANSPEEVATKAQHGGSEQDQVVVKSSPDLPSAPQPSVPSIGSLTAELRAITIPGIDSVGGTGGGVARLGPTSEPDSDLTQRRDLGAPAVAPATGIPASNSPATMAYRGPAPAVSAGAVTAPETAQVPAGQVQPSIPTGSAGVVSARHQAVRSSGADTRPVGQAVSRAVQSQPSPVFGSLNFCASIGLLGLLASLFLSGGAAFAAVGVAGFGLCGALALSLMTAGGSNLARVPLAIGVGVLGGVVLAGIGAVAPTDAPAPAPAPVVSPPAAEPEPAVAASKVEEPVVAAEERAVESATEDEIVEPAGEGLSAEELQEARSFEAEPVESESGSITASATKASKADVDPAAEARKAEAARKRDEERRAEAAKRAEKKRDEAAKREEAAQREAERKREESRGTGLGGPRRASLKKPEAGSPKEKKSSGPKPFVIDTIIRNNGNIKRCLEAERGRGQDLSGKIFLQFTISPDGGVSRAKLTTSRWAGTSLDSCISKQVNRLEFPPFDGNAKKIKYALVIQ